MRLRWRSLSPPIWPVGGTTAPEVPNIIIQVPCEKKLDHVGDRSRFDTDKVKWYEENETGGLTTCYTDHITRQPMFKAVLTTNIAPFWTNPEIDTKETRVIRSWNDDYRCLTCTGDRAQHPVLAREKDFWIIISDL